MKHHENSITNAEPIVKIAIVHDWISTYTGAERVLEQMLACFPNADLFSTVVALRSDQLGFLGDRSITTSFIQRLPFSKTQYRNYLPLMPLAVEQFDLSAYDLVISSSHAMAKGVLTGPDQLHLCMCYSPIRYAWDLQHQYLRESGLDHGPKGWLAKWLLHRIRIWDSRTANGVDRFIAISNFIARRIRRTYRRSSEVIYPPVDTTAFAFCEKKDNYYFTASRMVPYKRIDLIVEAFSAMPDKRLVVVGDGPDFEKIKAKAGQNIEMLGYQPFPVLLEHMQHAKAFVFAAEEDFGIAPVEAQACGTPVIAFGKGAATETIRGLDNGTPTGVFFWQQSIDALAQAVNTFETEVYKLSPEACRENAKRFEVQVFKNKFSDFVTCSLEDWRAQILRPSAVRHPPRAAQRGVDR